MQRVHLRLLMSQTMSEKGENDVVRFPLRARDFLGFPDNVVSIGKGEYEVALRVKKAYQPDVVRLTKMIRQGKVSQRESRSIGFVSRSTHQRISRKRGGSIWVTSGIDSITVGADPEFGLVGDDGILRRGNRIVPHAGLFGSDGPGVEVRPPPSRSHLEIISSIRNILHDAPQEAEKYEWRGGATYRDHNRTYWFGGHIHLGRPAAIAARDAGNGIYQKIATALDFYLALPLVRFDTPEPFRRRNGCTYGYGKAGDIRADYPEQDRFEYRVLSGLWLVHPTLAKIVVGAAKCVAETAYSKIAESKFDLDWANAPASRKGLLKSMGVSKMREVGAIINQARPEGVTEEHFNAWKRKIRQLDLFDNYAAELKALALLAKAAPSNIDLNLRSGWQLEDPLLPTGRGSAALRRALEAVEEKS